MHTYSGSCHCHRVRFSFKSEPLTKACRCNCSICVRKGAMMSEAYFAPGDIEVEGLDLLSVYRFGDRTVNHYFCPTCGVHPFHDGTTKPGHFRVNLNCVNGLDVFALEARLIDGKSF